MNERRSKSLKTFSARKEDVVSKWFVVDAEDKVLGRLATRVATILRGKHKPIFTPHVDTGDHVVIINAERIRLTGRKWNQKKYIHHSQYPGGLKEKKMGDVFKKNPSEVLKKAVWNMLPKNKLRSPRIKRLKFK